MKRLGGSLLALLLLFVGLQASLLLHRSVQMSEPTPGAPMLGVGDTVRALAGQTGRGSRTVVPLAGGDGSATVVYAFHPECAFSDSIAPSWSRWPAREATDRSRVRRLAVTMDRPEPARVYAERFGWEMDVLSMSSLGPSDREYALLAKTPWIFVFDSAGVLRFQGHGDDLELAEEAVRSLGGNP